MQNMPAASDRKLRKTLCPPWGKQIGHPVIIYTGTSAETQTVFKKLNKTGGTLLTETGSWDYCYCYFCIFV